MILESAIFRELQIQEKLRFFRPKKLGFFLKIHPLFNASSGGRGRTADREGRW